MDKKQFVKELKDKEQVKSVFLASDKAILTDRNGKSYLSLNLKDSSGAINARLWDRMEAVEPSFRSGDFIWIKGHVQVYQNRKQIVIHDLRPARSSEYTLDDFAQGPVRKIDELWQDFINFIASIEDVHIRTLLQNMTSENGIEIKIKAIPAAKSIHHSYMGGLLEHIVSICQLMDGLAKHYPWLTRDYLIFGAIFHDIGKIEELMIESGTQYSDKGRLVGHMAIGCEFIDDYSRDIADFPAELKDILKHIVLSHHGRLEYGSPVLPSFPEAYVVALIDDLDSKLNTMVKFMESELEGSEKWTRYNQGFDRYFYLEILKKKTRDQVVSEP
jgi:3'-5' exoribonuclease